MPIRLAPDGPGVLLAAMPEPVRTWLEVSHHAAFRVGGWAWVRADGAAVTGAAGGERRIDAERTALLGLIAALRSPGAPGPTRLHTGSDLVVAIPARLEAARAGDNPPAEDLDLWAQIMTALGAGTVQIVRVERAPATPSAFAAAWAELGRDRAKDKGPFTAPIPKSNLAKAGIEAVSQG